MRSIRVLPYVISAALMALIASTVVAENTDSRSASYFPAAEVATAFSTGAALLENEHYRVIASRRDKTGDAEVHARETDVFYVVSGQAEFVTGGRMLSPYAISADETRATGIVDGKQQTVSAGDVIVVPANTPHWFKSVSGPFLYFTVKPIAAPEIAK